MRRRWNGTLGVVLGVLGLGLATVGAAGTLPRLPRDFAFPQGDGSPGTVTFSHPTHVDERQPGCTGCHPALFSILEQPRPLAAGALRHARMERGAECGACHDGKAAFGLDNCTMCHREEERSHR
jgi:c(7)-type cytochrome triheme protein